MNKSGTVYALIATALLFAACADAKRPAPGKVCIKAYEQCVMPSGVLGVCNEIDCAAGTPPPCYVCRSQH